MKRTLAKALALAMTFSVTAVFPVGSGTVTAAQPTKPIAIIKLDDLRNNNTELFQRVAEIGKEKGFPVSFGVIGNSLEDDGNKKSYYDFIKKAVKEGTEIWHHGYTHAQTEYNTSSYEAQKESFGKTAKLLKEKCDYTVQTFGSPYNNSDATTIQVINKDFPQIKVIMLAKDPDNAATQLMLPTRANIEIETGVVNYDNFVKSYSKQINSPYIVLQGHPASWDDNDIAEFHKIIDFLKTEGVQFMTPYGYYEKVQADKANPNITPTPTPDPNAITVKFNGAVMAFDVEPKVINDRTMVPFRAIFDKLQATIAFDEATNTATATKTGKEVKITDGSKTAYVDGKAVELDVPATIVDGRFLVPLRFVSESMGCIVYWDEAKKTVVVRTTTPEKLAKANPEGSIPIKGCTFSSFFETEIGQLSYDGDIDTLWSAEGDAQWVSYDLGESMAISKVSIVWNKGDVRQAIFEVLVSDDGTNYKSVLEGKGAGNVLNQFEDYTLPTGTSARYVKILCKGNTASKWNAIKEIIFYK